MKRIIICYIGIVAFVTIYIAGTYEMDRISIKSINVEQNLEKYRKHVIATSEKYGWELTEEQIEEYVNDYKNIMESKEENRGLWQAFKKSLVISPIACVILFVGCSLARLHRREKLSSTISIDYNRYIWKKHGKK